MPIDAEKILCVVDVDLFVPGMNFVFGLAAGNAAVISLKRVSKRFTYLYVIGEENCLHELFICGFCHRMGCIDRIYIKPYSGA
jgi:predicted Zn-dependent protease